ncbi:hypothetical protein FE257_000230 [Aspergillus nanangensis]|uniref:Uncharacterized protein n=1 Tax=Aspergillus nanangensis TaxID=2582783 RepID=A0AAD4CZG6_ASPNN|nr:hypothetical protein FE257_000230 [Aspergillus nanangensis]
MVAKLILPLLSLSVFYAIFYYADANGLVKLAEQSAEAKTLPDFDAPLRTVYTGVEQIDHLLTVLTTFFWPSTDGSTPELTLHSIGFSGTFGSAWMLVCLEAYRRGNAWGLAAFPMIFGLTAQVLTFAFATPLYATIQLYTSITAHSPTAANIQVPRAVLNTLPYIFIVGYFVPSTLLVVPLSDLMTTDLKQICIAIWQPWPAYVSILLVVANTVFSPFVRNEGGRASLRALRRVYAFAFANAAITHLITVSVSVATVAAPALFQDQNIVKRLFSRATKTTSSIPTNAPSSALATDCWGSSTGQRPLSAIFTIIRTHGPSPTSWKIAVRESSKETSSAFPPSGGRYLKYARRLVKFSVSRSEQFSLLQAGLQSVRLAEDQSQGTLVEVLRRMLTAKGIQQGGLRAGTLVAPVRPMEQFLVNVQKATVSPCQQGAENPLRIRRCPAVQLLHGVPHQAVPFEDLPQYLRQNPRLLLQLQPDNGRILAKGFGQRNLVSLADGGNGMGNRERRHLPLADGSLRNRRPRPSWSHN